MAERELLARNSTAELNTGTDASPNFVAIEGIDSIAHSPTTNRADVRTFDDAGRLRHLVASRGDSFTFTGKLKTDPTNGDRAPGQEAVETWAADMGIDGIKQFRITDPSGNNTITFNASAQLNRPAGGNDDPASWGFSVEVDGAIS